MAFTGRRRSTAESLEIHRPIFDFCEPHSPDSPQSQPPPSLTELLNRARALKRRAVREENFDSVRQLDDEIAKLELQIGKASTGKDSRHWESSTKSAEKTRRGLDKILTELDKEVLSRRKRQFFGEEMVDGTSASELEQRARQLDSELEQMLQHSENRAGPGGSLGWVLPSANGHQLLPMATRRPGTRTFLWELEERANELDTMLEQTLLRDANLPGYHVDDQQKIELHQTDRNNHSHSRSRRASQEGQESIAAGWEMGHLKLLDQIHKFDAEVLGVRGKQRKKTSRRWRSNSRHHFRCYSPPILSRHTANWVQQGEQERQNESADERESPFAGTPRSGSSAAGSSDWNQESPFARPKNFHQRSHSSRRQRRRPNPEESKEEQEDELTLRLLTPPELKNGDQQSLTDSEPMLDRDHFLKEINPADRGFASHAVDLFGLETVANIYSKDWADRKLGIQQMLARLQQSREQPKEAELLEAAIPVLKRALEDPLFQVRSAGMALFAHLQLRLSAAGTDKRLQRKFAEATALELSRRIGDRSNDKRSSQLALEAVRRLFDETADPKLANLFLAKILRQSEASAMFSHPDLGQAEMVQRGVRRLWGVSGTGLNEQLLCPFLALCLASLDPEIRQIGRQLAEWIYTRQSPGSRRFMRQFLPLPFEDDVAARARPDFRQLLLLHDRWDSMDNEVVREKENDR